jgi:AraC-like DNA-binding protein
VYYGHYLAYLFLSYQQIQKYKTSLPTQEPAVRWLRLLLGALLALWGVYVLNLLEERIPYILGPILYSVIAYGVSFLALQKGYLTQLNLVKYKTTPLTEEEIDQVYRDVKKLLEEKELYRDPDLTLGMVSKALKVSTQKISLAVNSRSGSNFNGFVNQYRVRQAQLLLRDEKYGALTIASIALEVGFNSLTSFNTAFKKERQETPSAYRKGVPQP